MRTTQRRDSVDFFEMKKGGKSQEITQSSIWLKMRKNWIFQDLKRR
jgi:hypothetical protein